MDPQVAAVRTYIRGTIAEANIEDKFNHHLQSLEDLFAEAQKLEDESEKAAFALALTYFCTGFEARL